jgi:hypothetical protein
MEVPRASLRLTMRGEVAEQLNQASAMFEHMIVPASVDCLRRRRSVVARAQVCKRTSPARKVEDWSESRWN